MIAQFDWQVRFGVSKEVEERPSHLSYQVGGVLWGGVTAVFLFWLIFHYLLAFASFAGMPAVLRELLRLLEMAGGVTLAALWVVWAWQRQRARTQDIPAFVLSRAELYELSPSEFEQYVARLFRQKGYAVRLRGRSGDKGVDLELKQRSGKRAIVQCKRYRRPVGPEVVRELFGTLIHERVAHAFLVTTADISQSAREWALGKPITLIDGDLLVEASRKLTSGPP
ncbi:MAG: restriction endonuclease [Chloroflexi bacterium]|nr:restriction endonuclease [Chloroflexota bacterium]